MRIQSHQHSISRMSRIRALLFAVAILICWLSTSCKREKRAFQVSPPEADTIYKTSLTDLHAGATTMPVSMSTSTPIRNDYEDNAFAISQGQQLFEHFNC